MGEHRPDAERKQAELPPRPDPQTGEPFPPHAPGYRRAGVPAEEDPLRERRLARKPSAPEGMGPVLAWHRSNVKGNLVQFLISLAMLMAGMSLITLLRGDGIAWVQYWQLWLLLLVGALLMSSPFTVETLSVGADWVQISMRRPLRPTRGGVIKLYELIEVEGSSSPTGHFLRIVDKDGSSEMQIDEWQVDRRIWDLVYNGIVHSVAAGARINKHAIQLLHIDQTPALDIAQRTGRGGTRAPTTRRTGKHRPEA